MSKLSLLVYLNAVSDTNSSNNASLSNFKWTRDVSGIPCINPTSHAHSLAPGENHTLFSGTRTLLSDNTTNYSIALKPLSSNTYILTATSGTLPNFRTPRATGADSTTAITVTLNGPLATFTSTGGTPLNLAAVQVGDAVIIGNLFNQLSQGQYVIIANTSTSFTVANLNAAAEGPIVLGAGFASQIQIFSAAGVQIGDTLSIGGGFSQVTQGSYEVTASGANFVEFFSTEILPAESGILTTAIAIYSSAVRFVYIECDQNATITINGSQNIKIEPLIINNSVRPGLFMINATVYSLVIQSNSLNTANLFLATVE